MTSCTVYINQAIDKEYLNGFGGGVFNEGLLINCNIDANKTDGNGGGVENYGTMKNSRIYNNLAEGSGGGVSSSGNLINCIIYNNSSSRIGGGVLNLGILIQCIVYGNQAIYVGGVDNVGTMLNCTVYGNTADSIGGIRNSGGNVIDTISWKNPYGDIIPYNTGVAQFCCFREASEENGNFSANPLFVNTSGDISTWDFHLREGSPCIDAGHPDAIYNDACLPPGKGTDRNDMGAYGGPGNCWDGITSHSAILSFVNQNGEAWGADNKGIAPFGESYLRGRPGFKYAPSQGWYILNGDADQIEPDDLIQITPYGDVWVSISMDKTNFPPTRWGWLGFHYDEKDGYSGWLPLAGDVNGDGAGDLIQVTEYGDAWAALSKKTSFAAPTRWGWLGFKYAPYDGWYPLCGDVNADGKDDLVQITPTGDPWVALSNGFSFDAPTRWGWVNFYYNEEQGNYPILGDINSDGAEDLIQITPEGEVWVALSLGDVFDYPEYWGSPGFLFSRETGSLPFFLDF